MEMAAHQVPKFGDFRFIRAALCNIYRPMIHGSSPSVTFPHSVHAERSKGCGLIARTGFAKVPPIQNNNIRLFRATLAVSLLRVAMVVGTGVMAWLGAAMPAFAYDSSWHREANWSGEYPHGFTMSANATINIRERLDPDAPKTVSCLLKRGATYHIWNKQRVASDQLEFVSWTKIETYELNANIAVGVWRRSDNRKVVVNFRKGDRWSYLAYLAEGTFLMKFGDTVYVADQDLGTKSTRVAPFNNSDRSGYDEWLKLKCANGAVGWIFLKEIESMANFSTPKIIEYGTARDVP
jgi:hypothetical protein